MAYLRAPGRAQAGESCRRDTGEAASDCAHLQQPCLDVEPAMHTRESACDLGQGLYYYVPQFPHLQIGDCNRAQPYGVGTLLNPIS